MAQHFLLSREAKTLTLGHVFKMTDAEVEVAFRKVRWPDTMGEPVCPECGCLGAYPYRRKTGLLRFQCRECDKHFSITSGTLFASHKATLRTYLAAIAIFVNEVKGKAALAMSRDLGLSYKAAFVLCHKLREAMATELRGRVIGGEGKVAETDGAYFGGYVKPANIREDRKDRRFRAHKSDKRQVVVVVRERGGKTLPGIFRSEAAAVEWIKAKVAKETVLNADENPAWNDLHSRFEMRRINHQERYADGDTSTNQAESFFSRLRRAEMGHYHHIAGEYLIRYALESAWREDNRRVPNGAQARRVATLAMAAKASTQFTGYWQRHLVAEA